MNKKKVLEQIKNGLIVSCQALSDEPLHSSFIMGRMALAAYQGGAIGIRANTAQDIKEIKENVDLPIIGIVKKDYEDSEIYITPTIDEVRELVNVNCDIIALDATDRLRPNKISLDKFIEDVRKEYKDLILMADCSTYEEAIKADKLGFDIIATTLVGYTPQSKHIKINDNDFEVLKKIIRDVKAPVIAEGNIDTVEKCKRVLELGAFSVVVGSIITRPKLITEKFVKGIKGDS